MINVYMNIIFYLFIYNNDKCVYEHDILFIHI